MREEPFNDQQLRLHKPDWQQQGKAKEQGVTPKEYVDKIVAGIKDLWKLMDIDYSDFIRTTDDRHVK